MIQRCLCWLALLGMVLAVLYALLGCAPRIEYQPVPHWLIPAKPVIATVPAEALQCLNDDVYTRLAERDRACWQYARELRALLGPEMIP